MNRVVYIFILMMLVAACSSPAKPKDQIIRPTDARLPTAVPLSDGGPENRGMPKGTLSCAECKEEGMPARLWTSAQMNAAACELQWGTQVTILDTEGLLYRVNAPACSGWISKQLVLIGFSAPENATAATTFTNTTASPPSSVAVPPPDPTPALLLLPTVTPRPSSGSLTDEELTYNVNALASMQVYNEAYAIQAEHIGLLSSDDSAEYFSESWLGKLLEIQAMAKVAGSTLRALQPPPRFAEVHAAFLLAADHFDNGFALYSDSVAARDYSLFKASKVQISLAVEDLASANTHLRNTFPTLQ